MFEVIKRHRYFEKNHAILSLSFELGLTPKELAFLSITDVASFSKHKHSDNFRLREMIRLRKPKSRKIHKNQAAPRYERKYTFSLSELTRLVNKVIKDNPAEAPLDLQKYLPMPRETRKYTRTLPIISEHLRQALIGHIKKHPVLIRHKDQPSESLSEIPLFVSQKGGPYSPNTMQDHIRVILSKWAGFEGASGMSGRRTIVDKMIRERVPIKTIQQFLGHKAPATTVLHENIDFSDADDEAYAFSRVQNENSNA